MGVVPAFDELEDGQLRLGMGTEGASLDEFTFKCGEETLTHGVIVAIAHRTHGGAYTGLFAASSEGDRGVLAWSE